MHLDEPLLRLPLRFDGAALAREIDALPREAWTDHPQGYKGNAAVRFVTVQGAATDEIGTPMAPTRYLDACPYVGTVMSALGATWGRCRLMRLEPGANVPPHVDVDFYWRTHVRIHVPIVTNADVAFTVAGKAVHMAAGECWAFDTFARHSVQNAGAEGRTHLVMDTVGGAGLSVLVAAARSKPEAPYRLVSPNAPTTGALAFERQLGGTIMSPWELMAHLAFLRQRATPGPLVAPVFDRLDYFANAWHGAWAQFGDQAAGIATYGKMIAMLGADLRHIGDIGTIGFDNHVQLPEVMSHLIRALIHPDLMARAPRAGSALHAVSARN